MIPTEPKPTKELAREARHVLSSIIENTSDLIAAVDSDLNYIACNAAYQRECREILGLDIRVGANLAQLLAPLPEDQRNAIGLFRRALGGETVLVTEEFGAADKGRRVYELRFSPVQDESGIITAAAQIGRDITGRRRAEEALQESEERLKTALAAADLGVWDLDLATDCSASRSLRHDQMFGYEVLQTEWSQAIAERHVLEEDRPKFRQAFAEAAETGVLKCEVRVRWPDGSIHWIAPLGRTYYDDHGKAVRMAGVVADITHRIQAQEALRQSEARLRLALEATQLGTFEWDIGSGQTSADDRLLEIVGVRGTPGTDLNEEFRRRIHPEDAPAYHAALLQGLDPAGPGRFEHTHRVLCANGTVRWITVNGNVEFLGQGPARAPARAIGTVQDVTEQMEAARRQAFLLNLEEILRPLSDPLEAQTKALRLLGEHLDVNRICYVEIQGHEAIIRAQYVSGMVPIPDRFPYEMFGAASAAGESAAAEDVETSPLLRPPDRQRLRGAQIAAFASVKLTKDRRWVAALWVHSVRSRAWRSEELDLIRQTADRIWAAVEHAKAEAALRDNAEQFRAMFNVSSVGKAQADPQTGRFVRVNGAFCRMTGYTEAELLARTVHDLMLPNDRERGSSWFSRLCGGEARAYELEGRLVSAVGQCIWVHVSANVIKDAAGRPVRATAIIQDITGRKRIEEELRNSEERFKLAMQGAGVGLWDWNIQTGKVYYSPRWKALFGYEEHEIGDTVDDWIKLLHPEERDSICKLQDDFLAGTGNTIIAEYRLRHKDGVYRWIEASAVVVRDGNGKARRLVGSHGDISARKQAELALQRSRSRSELLSNTISMLLAAPDPQTVVEGLCNRVREFLGCAVFFNFLLDRATGRLRFNACGGVDSRLARKVEQLQLGESLCGTAARDACCVHAQQLSLSDDPRSALVRSLGVRAYACHPLVGPDNEVIGTLSFGACDRDSFEPEDLKLMKAVTDHVSIAMLRRRADDSVRASERLYRAIGESINYGIWICDAQGRNVYASESFLKLVGMTQQECSEFGWGNVLHPEDAAATIAAWKQCAKTGGPWYWEHRYRGVDGLWHPILACGVPVRNERGEIVQWAGINLDISRLKQAQDELRAAKDELARQNEDLERIVQERTAKLRELVGELEHFSYTITHDMRAPLRAMRGFAEMLEETAAEAESPQHQAMLRRIISAAERMDLLITDALSYSKAVRQELPLAPVDLGALLRSMLDTYPEFQPSKADIEVEPELPLVMGNEAGLTQCFSNLLANAVKFVEPGKKPEVWIRSEAGLEWIRIWIEDHGIGIPASMLPRVFEMFSRGQALYPGTGIGLALVRKVVDRMGGRVGVESQEGKGSRFWVELKAAPPGERLDSRDLYGSKRQPQPGSGSLDGLRL